MNLILNFITQAFSFAIPMIVLLGVLIFIHELGHFMVAKYFNVKVETFSLGFGPKIWKHTRGETTYCISAIPFGGYVKMFGDEMGGEVHPELQNRSFLHKPIRQRIAIALAGPIMNLLLAFVIFVVIAFVGENVIAPQLGDIDESSKAYVAGFRSGDKILSIDGKDISRWEEVDHTINRSLNKQLNFVVQRELAEEPIALSVTPEGTDGKLFDIGETVGQIEGLDFISNSSLIAISDPKSIMGQLGFRTGDQIMTINGVQVKTLRNLQEAILTEAGAEKIIFKIDRHDLEKEAPPVPMEIVWDLKKISFPDVPDKLGIQKPETFVGRVSKDSPAEAAGLKPDDHIVSINDKPMNSFKDIITAVSSYTESTGPLHINIIRQGLPVTVNITPKMTEIKQEMGPAENRPTIGIIPLKATYIEYKKWRSPTFLGAFTWAFGKTWYWTKTTVMSFALLVQNKVSPKNLSGFISIGQMAQKSWQIGIDAFLRIMAIISLNLFILNLLPIPVLDGGHILLFTIEAIKGAPLSIKKIMVAQQIGVFFLLFLMAFSLFNDISRLLGFS
jgi:regulator of sigma E protease